MGRTVQWHNIEGSPIIVTENVLEYRHCIAQYVGDTDVALEVGCAEGLTTAIIAQHASKAYGIDKSSSQIAKAKERHDKQRQRLHFHQIEAWDLNSMLRLATADDVQFNVVFIDVSGSRRVGDVDNLIMKYEQVFNPRLFIVKSYQLKRLLNRCQLHFCPNRPGNTQLSEGDNAVSTHHSSSSSSSTARPAATIQMTGSVDQQQPLQLGADGTCAGELCRRAAQLELQQQVEAPLLDPPPQLGQQQTAPMSTHEGSLTSCTE